jgi:hypothetical protein
LPSTIGAPVGAPVAAGVLVAGAELVVEDAAVVAGLEEPHAAIDTLIAPAISNVEMYDRLFTAVLLIELDSAPATTVVGCALVDELSSCGYRAVAFHGKPAHV